MTKATILSEVDKAALELAMQIARQEPGRGEQLDGMLQYKSWFEVAWFAAGCCQERAMNLKPWEAAPACICVTDPPDSPANLLCDRMIAAGISQFHPDPLAALEEAERKGAA